jgi:hypothetical protein
MKTLLLVVAGFYDMTPLLIDLNVAADSDNAVSRGCGGEWWVGSIHSALGTRIIVIRIFDLDALLVSISLGRRPLEL